MWWSLSCSVISMALIEGIGDEVTILCAILLLISLIALAWISTHTSERGSAPWWSQASAGRGAEPQPRPPVNCTDRPPDSGEPEGPTSDTAEDAGSSSTSLDSSLSNHFTSVDQRPSSSCVSPPVRHRGPPTHGDSTGTQNTITLRLKFLNETERVVSVRLTDSVLHIKRSQFPEQESLVRLIYQGQLLRDDSQTVASLQLADGCVLHCHLSQHAPASVLGGDEPSQDSVNIGSLMIPLFLLLLGLLWYCVIQYPHVFSATATACLGAMTLFVLVLVFSSYRR
ncbi:transmembrane and ubiquitin-like domain-containing protein 1 [Ranitomeya imitator]|uniref:transmembrane and ubiquitin-like domain-containing protein 1 n=1 Tax=Ranitomeya imitator TaxID=111125 RepID=UPI0037E95C83